MFSITNALRVAPALLAGALSLAPTNAEACSTAAWTAISGAPVASGPATDSAFLRYSGACALRPAATAPSYVAESTNHAAEGGATPFRARFFVYTGLTGGSPVVFRALDGSAATVIDITYDAATQNFTFAPAGVTAASTAANSAPLNRWIMVSFVYQAGQPFTASTRHLGTTTSITPTANVGSATVEEVRLGFVSGSATGTLYFDEYEASRATDGTGAFPMVCRGDANASAQYDLADIFGVVDEFLRAQGDSTRSRANGQPEYNEDGQIALEDIFGVVDAFLAVQAGGAGCTQ